MSTTAETLIYQLRISTCPGTKGITMYVNSFDTDKFLLIKRAGKIYLEQTSK